ncbi:MAG: T9SS type A sorting domain-containing protein [Bacteroidetes bacterium]|nr:T9SS type A sorting domain-containing protein [Bacteroidota bacterium]
MSVEANLERIWRKPNIAYLVFVQNDETKEIIQAAVTTTVTDIEDIKELPLTFGLAQNYPNPFNPSTVIKYQIPESSIVSLKVFDMLGREIKVLVNEQKNAGEYSVELDASQYSSGVYFYELRCNNFVNSRKMLLMK